MADWQSKEMGDGIQAYAPSEALFSMVQALKIPQGIQRNFAVFSRYDLHENVVTWYFSPEAAVAAAAFGAARCEKPVPGRGFGLLTGDPGAWDTYFPEYITKVRRGER